MSKSVDIKNFRGFKHAHLSDCRHVNVIVGDNGAGKTALLEAIFIAGGGSPELAFRFKQWRGIDVIQAGGSRQQITEALFGDLFHDYASTGTPVEIKLSGGDELHARTLRIEGRATGSVVFTLPKYRGDMGTADQQEIISFDWIGPRNIRQHSTMSLTDGKIVVSGSHEAPLQVALFAANPTYSSAETVGRFSSLSKFGKEKVVIDAIRAQYKWVKSISIELLSGVPLLFAQLDGRAQKMPINILSGGMSKLVSILFALPTCENGMVLIDELENGFYHERFPMIWTILMAMAEEFNVQLFVSSHSQECLEAAADVAAKNPGKFSIIRAVRTDKECTLKQFDGDRFTTAIEANVEIR